MSKKLQVDLSITIDASPERVWNALTDPAIIKKYLFGTDAKSDWKKGSKLTYTGEWQGKPYVDKGEIVDIVPGKLLHTTYLSGNSGKADVPENYNNVIYTLEPRDGKTVVHLTQDNIESEEGVKKMEQNWGMVLEQMKKVVETF
ncbi:MAG TPA: SRPBCC family protein [Chitinophagaceae bacterium]|jgi:uncharacterized protein YndB with AHSA1/START domain|nr:SRPBCC family protein [Chitinophagaceae bacterium]